MDFICCVFISLYSLGDDMSEQDHGTIERYSAADWAVLDEAQELVNNLHELVNHQERLGPEFEKILADNLEDLYEIGDGSSN